MVKSDVKNCVIVNGGKIVDLLRSGRVCGLALATMPAPDPIYALTIALLIAFVFAFAGVHKVMDYARHVGVVADYQVVPAAPG